MKKNHLLLLLIFVFGTATIYNVQAQRKPFKNNEYLKPVLKPTPLTGSEVFMLPQKQDINIFNSNRMAPIEREIGSTWYDLQTNSSTQNRVMKKADGTIAATWTMANLVDDGFSDRGTGYNTNASGDWLSNVNTRLETVRTGWPDLAETQMGEIIVSHRSPGPWNLQVLRKMNDGSWTQADLPSVGTPGLFWPRIAVGGPDGNTVHAIAITVPVGNGGVEYGGIDGQVLYYRSLDGGQTWDIKDMSFPGVDSRRFGSMSADAYAIDCIGNTVAVALFNSWGDLIMSKSEDNGDNWATTTVWDFPLDGYREDEGYTIDDIPLDTFAPNELAIRTTEGAGDIIIDHNGLVHMWFNETYVMDDDPLDQTTSYFPFISGLWYWNENMATDEFQLVGDLVDVNGNDTIDIVDFGRNNSSILTHPTAGIATDGTFYVAWAMATEEYLFENANPSAQNFFHVYLINSADGGATWSEPYDLINADVTEWDFIPYIDGQFPSMYRNVDDIIHLVYQQGFEPGLNTNNDENDDAEYNSIMYVPLDLIILTSTKNVQTPETFKFELSPNPATDFAVLSFELEKAAKVQIDLYSIMGSKVKNLTAKNLSAGQYHDHFMVNNLTAGVYFIRLQVGDEFTTTKLVVK